MKKGAIERSATLKGTLAISKQTISTKLSTSKKAMLFVMNAATMKIKRTLIFILGSKLCAGELVL
jgi:hypothetical protein